MISGLIEGGAAILLAIFGCTFLFGQLKNNAERNARDIEAIKEMIKEYQEDTQDMIAKNMGDVKSLIDENKIHQSDSLSREVSHLRDLINMSNAETRAAIQRLEVEQKESNVLKMKFAVLAQSVKSLHKRLDIELPALLDDD